MKNPGNMLRTFAKTGMLEQVLPEVFALIGVKQDPKWHPEGDAFVHTCLVVDYLPNENFELQMAGILHDIGKAVTTEETEKGISSHGHEEASAEMAEIVCDRLRMSNERKEKIVWLVANHMKLHHASELKKSTLRKLIASPHFEDLRKLAWADAMASNKDLFELTALTRRIYDLEKEGIPKELPAPLITGNDLIVRGLKPGPDFRTILGRFMDMQLENPSLTRERALAELDNLIQGVYPDEQ